MYNNTQIISLLNRLAIPDAEQKAEELDEKRLLNRIESIVDVYELIKNIGILYGVSEAAESLVEELEERINIVVHKLKFISEEQKQEVLILNSLAPFDYGGSNYYDALIRAAGGKPALLKEGDEVSDPDLLILLAKEKGMQQLLSEVPMVLDLPEWKDVAAVKNNSVFFVEGTQQLQHHYAQVADDVELLAEILYPQYFVFGGNGESWMKFEL